MTRKPYVCRKPYMALYNVVGEVCEAYDIHRILHKRDYITNRR